ncbi:MAG: YkgJ family cysteine cluster protein [Candidatus Methylopumilus sp.]|nr:YkgJ family cysteine cluster protein [Candidatus Methylopumilus sp.]
MDDLTNPCFECGQCCQHFRVSFYHAEIEGNNVGKVPFALTSQINDHLVCMKGTELGKGRCIALNYAEETGYRCSIYELRPTPCREFELYENGKPNAKCNELRVNIGLSPLPDKMTF